MIDAFRSHDAFGTIRHDVVVLVNSDAEVTVVADGMVESGFVGVVGVAVVSQLSMLCSVDVEVILAVVVVDVGVCGVGFAFFLKLLPSY